VLGYLVASPAKAGDTSGPEGVGEQVGDEGGKVGVLRGSPPFQSFPFCVPPPLWLSCTPHIPRLRGGGCWWWCCCWGFIWCVGGL
jgi:hypothetical protein